MIKRNFPLIVLFLVFLGLLDFIWQVTPYKAPLSQEDESAVAGPEKSRAFTGRMDMPNLDDIWHRSTIHHARAGQFRRS